MMTMMTTNILVDDEVDICGTNSKGKVAPMLN
jgi:hypothetical protein